MLIPEHVCRELYRKHKNLRWAWEGRDDVTKLNAGGFALVQLYHISDCGTYDNPQTYRAFWDVKTVEGWDGTARVTKDYKGPIFSKTGSTLRDWDPLFRFPIHVITLDEHCKLHYPWGEFIKPIDDVYSGKIMHAIDYWLRPQDERIVRSHQEKQDRVVRKCEDMGAAAADRVWWDSQQTDYSARRDIAYKHAKPEIVAAEKKREKDPIREYLRVPKMPCQELKRAKH